MEYVIALAFLTLTLPFSVVSDKILKFCYYKNFDESDLKVKNIDVLQNRTLILACRDCDNEPNREKKYWYKKTIFPNMTLSEESTIEQMKKVSVYTDSFQRLVIEDLNDDDIGFYYCKRLQDDDIKYGFTYFVDVVQYPQVERFKGDSTTFLTYYESYMRKANDELKVFYNFTIFVDWGKWNGCSTNVLGERVKKRFGKCRMKSIVPQKNIEIDGNVLDVSFSCYSSLIDKRIKEIIGEVPLYEYFKDCKRWFVYEDNGDFESESKEVVLDVGSSWTLVCPRSNVYSNVTWYKDDEAMYRPNNVTDHKDAHIYFDAMSILYLVDVNEKDEGVYTCEVNGKTSLNLNLTVKKRPDLNMRVYFLNLFFMFSVSFALVPFYCCSLRFYLKKHLLIRSRGR